jgi:hypothetical protein
LLKRGFGHNCECKRSVNSLLPDDLAWRDRGLKSTRL